MGRPWWGAQIRLASWFLGRLEEQRRVTCRESSRGMKGWWDGGMEEDSSRAD